MARYLILFLSVFTVLYAEIFETTRMEEILPFVDETTWVLFDIDDTLLESELQAGRTKWFYHEFAKQMAEGKDKNEVIRSVDEEYLKIVDLCPIRTPEPEILYLIERIKQTAGAVLGLTARGPHLCPTTIMQFERLGIDLSSHAPKIALESGPTGHYENGILFAIDQKKGPALHRLIEKSDQRPTKIIFIDDQKRHLLEAEEIASVFEIPFIGFHYTKTSERPFDQAQGDLEHRQLLEKAAKKL